MDIALATNDVKLNCAGCACFHPISHLELKLPSRPWKAGIIVLLQSMANTMEVNLENAKLAEQAERYEDMAKVSAKLYLL